MLTPEQEQEAKRLYVESQLSPEDVSYTERLRAAKVAADKAQAAYRELQRGCAHPLIARETKNRGNTGNWDRGDDSYWTEHHCTLCCMRWTTGQRWQHVGGKLGLPDDTEAKER